MNRKIFLILSLTFLFASCASLLNDAPHVSDDWLIKNFQKNEADFDLLAQMAQQDSKMVRIANDFTWTKDSVAFPRPESELGITNERWEDYKKLFKKLRLSNGIINYQPDTILLLATTKGLVTGGSMKGYAYLKEKPEMLVDSLDNYIFPKTDKHSAIAYKQINNNWYIFYEVD